MVKDAAQCLARTLEASGVLGALERLDNSHRLRVLVYHRIDEPTAEPDLDPGLISATPCEFREQMRLIADHYHPVSLRSVLLAQRCEARLPSAAVLITFDDGYLDFAMHAWPVLRDMNLPAVLFVPTAFPDHKDGPGFWWDQLYAALRRTGKCTVKLPEIGVFDLVKPTGLRSAQNACKHYVKSLPHGQAMDWVSNVLRELPDIPPLARVLDWDSLRELAAQGLDICAHGHDHALCTQLSSSELRADLSTCQNRLKSEINVNSSPPAIAWPANACNQESRDVANLIGFEMAFGGIRGVARFPAPEAMNVMRIPVIRYQKALFRAQLRPAVAGLGRWVVDRPWRATA